MELIFLERSTLKYKDHSIISNTFDLVIDLVVNQKSNFILNREDVNVSIGDIAVLKGTPLNYIGIVETISRNKDKTIKVQLNDFKEIFNVNVPAQSFTGDVCEFLSNKIKSAFINNKDSKQNLKYLNVIKNATKEGTLTYDDNAMVNILDLMELITKTYGLLIKFKVEFVRGRFSFINVVVEPINNAHKLRYNLRAISNVEINDTKENSINKITFYPKKENKVKKEEISYYLLNDGTITTDANHKDRPDYVSFASEYYSDDEFKNIDEKATQALLKQGKDHEISFDLDLNNNVFIPLSNFFLGTSIEFYSKNKKYNTLLTQIKYKNNLNTCRITLGEHRSTLTDKIKLLGKNGGVGGVSRAGGTAQVATDGGEY